MPINPKTEQKHIQRRTLVGKEVTVCLLIRNRTKKPYTTAAARGLDGDGRPLQPKQNKKTYTTADARG